MFSWIPTRETLGISGAGLCTILTPVLNAVLILLKYSPVNVPLHALVVVSVIVLCSN